MAFNKRNSNSNNNNDDNGGGDKKKFGFHTAHRFPNRRGKDWEGPVVDYKEVDLLRKFMTTSAKMMTRKRAGTSSQEQRALKEAIKQARFMALLPYTST